MRTILAIFGGGLVALSAPAQTPPQPDPDPFGNEASVAAQLKNRGHERTDSEAGKSSSGNPRQEVSLLFRNIHNQTNPDSMLAAVNPTMALPTTLDVMETRVTLSDRFGGSDRFRWLLKGFNSISTVRGTDGRLLQESRLDEGFLDWRGENWFANLGKRRITWGHALAFNPVNVVVPPRDPLDPSRETEGQPMLWMSRTVGPQSFDAILTRNYTRDYVSDGARWGLRWQRSGSGFDFAVYYFDGQAHPDGRSFERMTGASFSADAYPGLTVYLESARFQSNPRDYYRADGSTRKRQDPYWQTVAGAGYNLGGRGRLGLEIYRNGQGYGKEEFKNYLESLQRSGTAAKDVSLTAMNRDYALLSYRDEIRERTTLDLSLLAARDRSWLFRAQVAYALSDYYEASLVILRAQGGSRSEIGLLPVTNSMEFRFTAHF